MNNNEFLIEEIVKNNNYDKLSALNQYPNFIMLLSKIVDKGDKGDKGDIRIQILGHCNGDNIKRMCKSEYRWNNMVIVDKNPDYYIIFDTSEDANYDPSKTILFSQNFYIREYLKEEWKNVDEKKFLKVLNNDVYTNLTWSLNKTYKQLKEEFIEKTKDNKISVLMGVSNTSRLIKKRNFIKYMQSNYDNLDIYNLTTFDFYDKEIDIDENTDIINESLLPYKYAIVVESDSKKNYMSENLTNAILAECLVFYNGCLNYKEYIDEKAVVHIPFSNFAGDLGLIKDFINKDLYNERLPYIKQAKQKILDELQFFPRIEKILN